MCPILGLAGPIAVWAAGYRSSPVASAEDAPTRRGEITPELLLEVCEAQGMMQDSVAAEVVAVGAPSDKDDRHILGIRASNGIGNAEASDHESDDDGRHALGTGIAISCIAWSARTVITTSISGRTVSSQYILMQMLVKNSLFGQ